MHLFRYSELGFCSHTGLNLAHGIIATLSRDMQVLTHRPVSNCSIRVALVHGVQAFVVWTRNILIDFEDLIGFVVDSSLWTVTNLNY
jgi:hypothetical protein